MKSEISRPPLRWHGGKWRLAPWLLEQFPPHRRYIEAYGGGASVLMRKPRSHVEIYNDLDDDVVTFFRLMQDPASAVALEAKLRMTPFARREFEEAYRPTADPIEIARRLVVRAFMGFGSDGHNAEVKTGFRANSDRSHTTPAYDWANYPDILPAVCERLRGVVIEHRPALDVIRAGDMATALHFLDPPYLPDVRSKKSRRGKEKYHAYKHEMTVDDHVEMLETVVGLDGMVVLCGYPSALYDDKLPGWRRREKQARADGARPRIEAIWINPAAEEALSKQRRGHGSPLFEATA